MKKEYETPSIRVITLDICDIICDSDPQPMRMGDPENDEDAPEPIELWGQTGIWGE